MEQVWDLIERFVVLSSDPVITHDDLPTVMKACLRQKGSAGTASRDSGFGFEDKLATFERDMINETLAKCGGNKTEAAALLGISRYSLLRKIKRLSNAGFS